MDEGVVALAQECGVVQVGRPTVCPVLHMVGFGPSGWCIAAGVGASVVTLPQDPALGSGEEPLGHADVDDLAIGAENRGDEVGVAAELAQGLDAEEGAVGAGVQHARGALVLAQVLESDGDLDAGVGGGWAAVLVGVGGCVPGGEGDESLRAALSGATQVALTSLLVGLGRGQWSDGCFELGGLLGCEAEAVGGQVPDSASGEVR